jgi:hypothetical protein
MQAEIARKNVWASTKDASWAIGTIVVIFGVRS